MLTEYSVLCMEQLNVEIAEMWQIVAKVNCNFNQKCYLEQPTIIVNCVDPICCLQHFKRCINCILSFIKFIIYRIKLFYFIISIVVDTQKSRTFLPFEFIFSHFQCRTCSSHIPNLRSCFRKFSF